MRKLSLLLILVIVVVPQWLFATLGGDSGSVERDRQLLGARRPDQRLQRQALSAISESSALDHELLILGATRIRQYKNSQGEIYAVTWEGFKVPTQLDVLLGSDLFAEFNERLQELRNPASGRRPLMIETERLSGVLAGHQRSWFGKVLLKSKTPSGVKLEDLQ